MEKLSCKILLIGLGLAAIGIGLMIFSLGGATTGLSFDHSVRFPRVEQHLAKSTAVWAPPRVFSFGHQRNSRTGPA